jgi:hypothetical protein
VERLRQVPKYLQAQPVCQRRGVRQRATQHRDLPAFPGRQGRARGAQCGGRW